MSTDVAASWPHTRSFRPPEIVIIVVVSSTIELLAWWLRQKRPLSVERIAEIQERLIIAPAMRLHEEAGAKSTRVGRK